MDALAAPPPTQTLPEPFGDWFAGRGWAPHAHQLAMLEAAKAGESALLIAPTGGGKTLAGFLPTLIDLAANPREGFHTLYISPLKALAVDIHRNLEAPIAEMGLAIRAETRTGDTPQSKRTRQRRRPPHILMTTPESLALLLSYDDAPTLFAGLAAVIVDETHALADNKRGDLLSLGLARLASLAPQARRVGLSATVARPAELARWLSDGPVRLIEGAPGPEPEIAIVTPTDRMPWSGHSGLHAITSIYAAIKGAGTAIVFVNTRAFAEIIFQALWRINDDNLAIALHHGSLAAEQRRKVEAAMARGDLKAVVATSSLDLGIDWGAVDLVIQVGAPKGASRLLQRIGRANHRLEEPSRALLVPANRFEVLECEAAMAAVRARELDGKPPRTGGLDVLAQHMLGVACSAPFEADALYEEVRRAAPYANLSRRDFDDVLDFVATGGYALRSYERWRRVVRGEDGRWQAASKIVARQYRMNIGTIVETEMLTVRFRRGPVLGKIEEHFIQALVPGDTFAFAGRILAFEGVHEMSAIVSRAKDADPRVPVYAGGRLPLTTELADRVRGILADPSSWSTLPPQVREWLEIQRWRSELPQREGLLVETFPRADRWFLVAYGFAGRNAHQTLGMLLTKRMERAGLHPTGFQATDYAIAAWSLNEPTEVAPLFDEDMLGDDLEAWMAESSLLKRTFRNVAVIAGLIERRHPGQRKTGRQVTFSSDLIYDVLRSHEPNHILLRATRADAGEGLTDVTRLAELLARVQGRIVHRRLDKVSPLAVPVLVHIGKEAVGGAAYEALLDEAAEELAADAMAVEPQKVMAVEPHKVTAVEPQKAMM
ncbi:MAG TPA: ligase-associated DNA damage response DEXH box helicase [Alphaproteobacteria bacterium]|nr:ligase-associated DNA damage response DEXH box helicase [Alphaproteobacteria bacterium]